MTTNAAAQSLLSGRRTAVFGGPGTGKTEQILDSYGQLTARAGESSVLVLTPSREHADALRDRLPADDSLRQAPAARSVHSYAFSLVAAQSAAEYGRAVDFISGADQEYLLASVLDGYASGRVTAPEWPERFGDTLLKTAGFRHQLRDALNAAMGHGIAPAQLLELGRLRGVQAWQALAVVLQDYEDLLAVPVFGGVDTAAVFARAAQIVRGEDAAPGRSWSFAAEVLPAWILLDGAQDFPDTAVDFLLALEDKGAVLGSWSSPDTVVQSFRGAGGRTVDALASDAEVITLDGAEHVHRGSGGIRRVYDSLARIISSDLHRRHVPASSDDFAAGDSEVMAAAVGSQSEQARLAASLIRTWHSEGTAWDDIAVLSRSSGSAAALAAELASHGIPVQRRAQPLSSQPATAHILRLLALDDAADLPRLCEDIVTGPYVGLDAVGAGRLRRALLTARRHAERNGESDGGENGDLSLGALLADAVQTDLARQPRAVKILAAVLAAAERTRTDDPETAVWEVWEAFGAAEDWRKLAESDPEDGHNDHLDAVIRLQALAEKFTDRGTVNAQSFAETVLGQAVVQDSLASFGESREVVVSSPAAVAHREFEHVIIADVQDGSWPNLRVRGSVFLQQRLDEELAAGAWKSLPGAEDPGAAEDARPGERGPSYLELQRETVRDEGRMFLAALSRARSRAAVLAVADGEAMPSVFFDHVLGEAERFGQRGTAPAHTPRILGSPGEQHHSGAPADLGPASLRQLVGYVRQQFENSGSAEAGPWAALLAALRAAGAEAADERTWNAWQERSSTQPIYAADDIVSISPSSLDTFLQCPLKWLLSRHAGALPTTHALQMGNLIHALAERHPHGGYREMREAFEHDFAALEFASEWEKSREHADGLDMVENLNDFLVGRRAAGYELVGVEKSLVADSGSGWRITGRIDRLERDSAGRLHIVDFKTGRTPRTGPDVQQDPQLAAYQVGLGLGGAVLVDDEGRAPVSQQGAGTAGGMLMYPRKAAGTKGTSNIRVQDPMDAQQQREFANDIVAPAAASIRSAVFPARPSDDACRTCPVKRSCPAVHTGDDE